MGNEPDFLLFPPPLFHLFPHCAVNETDDKDGNYPQDLWESPLAAALSSFFSDFYRTSKSNTNSRGTCLGPQGTNIRQNVSLSVEKFEKTQTASVHALCRIKFMPEAKVLRFFPGFIFICDQAGDL